jgi:hypothetical protein
MNHQMKKMLAVLLIAALVWGADRLNLLGQDERLPGSKTVSSASLP